MMSLQYVVQRGDSLWHIAGRHLGNPARWPELLNYHNEQIGRLAGNRTRVFRIKDPNRIYAGQILCLPVRDKRSLFTTKATGARHEAVNKAISIDLKIDYSFGYDEKPLYYLYDDRNHVISVEIKGKIAIELISPDRYVYNLELITAKDERQLKQNLNDIYNLPFCALTAKPEMEFRQNNVILKFPALIEGNKVTYSVNVSSKAQRKMTGSLKAKTVTGVLVLGGRKFKCSSDMEFIVNVVEKQDFNSWFKGELASAGKYVKDFFTNEDNLKEIGKGFGEAGKVVVIAKTFVAVKAYAIFDMATGGPVTTTTMVAAGTPTGQKVLMEFIPSLNPSELPSTTWTGLFGCKIGSAMEETLTQ